MDCLRKVPNKNEFLPAFQIFFIFVENNAILYHILSYLRDMHVCNSDQIHTTRNLTG